MAAPTPVAYRTTPISIRDLSRTNLAYSLSEVSGTWGLIAVCFLLTGRTRSVVAYVGLALAMISLQQALLTLLHDSWHGHFARNKKLNDLMGKYFISFPCAKLWGRLKREHLLHHAYLGLREDDPTFLLYGYEAGEPRDRPMRFALKRLGGRLIEIIVSAVSGRAPAAGAEQPEAPAQKSSGVADARLGPELLWIAASQCVLFWAISRVAPWWAYFVLWLFPLATITPLLNLIRTFCEHAHPVTDDAVHPDERLISFRSNWLELMFVAPFHFNYHAEHHLYMQVPHYRLPALRRRMEGTWGRIGFPIRSSYVRVLLEHFGSR